jgi:hypothetical protein
MAMDLITLEQCKVGLNITDPDQDARIRAYIAAASQAVMLYLKDTSSFINTGGVSLVDVPAVARQATIVLVGYMLREPDGDEQKAWQMGYLPAPVTALLYPLRTPTLA